MFGQSNNQYKYRITKICGKAVSALCGVFALMSFAAAAPTGGVVTYGAGATISQAPNAGNNGTDTFVNAGAGTNNTYLSWTGFNVGSTEAVNFNHSGAQHRFFNDIRDSSRSTIAGAINGMGSNTSVYLFNKNGITIANGSQINVTGNLVMGGIDDANKSLLLANIESPNFNGVTINMNANGFLRIVDGSNVVVGNDLTMNVEKINVFGLENDNMIQGTVSVGGNLTLNNKGGVGVNGIGGTVNVVGDINMNNSNDAENQLIITPGLVSTFHGYSSVNAGGGASWGGNLSMTSSDSQTFMNNTIVGTVNTNQNVNIFGGLNISGDLISTKDVNISGRFKFDGTNIKNLKGDNVTISSSPLSASYLRNVNIDAVNNLNISGVPIIDDIVANATNMDISSTSYNDSIYHSYISGSVFNASSNLTVKSLNIGNQYNVDGTNKLKYQTVDANGTVTYYYSGNTFNSPLMKVISGKSFNENNLNGGVNVEFGVSSEFGTGTSKVMKNNTVDSTSLQSVTVDTNHNTLSGTNLTASNQVNFNLTSRNSNVVGEYGGGMIVDGVDNGTITAPNIYVDGVKNIVSGSYVGNQFFTFGSGAIINANNITTNKANINLVNGFTGGSMNLDGNLNFNGNISLSGDFTQNNGYLAPVNCYTLGNCPSGDWILYSGIDLNRWSLQTGLERTVSETTSPSVLTANKVSITNTNLTKNNGDIVSSGDVSFAKNPSTGLSNSDIAMLTVNANQIDIVNTSIQGVNLNSPLTNITLDSNQYVDHSEFNGGDVNIIKASSGVLNLTQTNYSSDNVSITSGGSLIMTGDNLNFNKDNVNINAVDGVEIKAIDNFGTYTNLSMNSKLFNLSGDGITINADAINANNPIGVVNLNGDIGTQKSLTLNGTTSINIDGKNISSGNILINGGDVNILNSTISNSGSQVVVNGNTISIDNSSLNSDYIQTNSNNLNLNKSNLNSFGGIDLYALYGDLNFNNSSVVSQGAPLNIFSRDININTSNLQADTNIKSSYGVTGLTVLNSTVNGNLTVDSTSKVSFDGANITGNTDIISNPETISNLDTSFSGVNSVGKTLTIDVGSVDIQNGSLTVDTILINPNTAPASASNLLIKDASLNIVGNSSQDLYAHNIILDNANIDVGFDSAWVGFRGTDSLVSKNNTQFNGSSTSGVSLDASNLNVSNSYSNIGDLRFNGNNVNINDSNFNITGNGVDIWSYVNGSIKNTKFNISNGYFYLDAGTGSVSIDGSTIDSKGTTGTQGNTVYLSVGDISINNSKIYSDSTIDISAMNAVNVTGITDIASKESSQRVVVNATGTTTLTGDANLWGDQAVELVGTVVDNGNGILSVAPTYTATETPASYSIRIGATDVNLTANTGEQVVVRAYTPQATLLVQGPVVPPVVVAPPVIIVPPVYGPTPIVVAPVVVDPIVDPVEPTPIAPPVVVAPPVMPTPVEPTPVVPTAPVVAPTPASVATGTTNLISTVPNGLGSFTPMTVKTDDKVVAPTITNNQIVIPVVSVNGVEIVYDSNDRKPVVR